jgi:SOS-response transcriptional repressor LexA
MRPLFGPRDHEPKPSKIADDDDAPDDDAKLWGARRVFYPNFSPCPDIIQAYSYCVILTSPTAIAVLGQVSAGRPTKEDGDDGGGRCIAVDLSTIGVSPNARTFALRVRGDSMTGAHILDGDTIVLEMKPAHEGAIVAALVDGESTLKRYFMRRGVPYLKADNPKYPDVIPARELVIQGVVVAVFRKT